MAGAGKFKGIRKLADSTTDIFPVEIISHAVWSYFCFCLSYRVVEELLFELDRIAMWIDESLDPGMEQPELFLPSRANRVQRRRIIDASAASEHRHEEVGRGGLPLEVLAAGEVERIQR